MEEKTEALEASLERERYADSSKVEGLQQKVCASSGCFFCLLCQSVLQTSLLVFEHETSVDN